MAELLWLHGPTFSLKMRNHMEQYMRQRKVEPGNTFFVSIHKKVPNLWHKRTKTQWTYNKELRAQFNTALRDYIAKLKPKIIVINDKATLGFISGNISLDLCRGSVYTFDDIPCIVIDEGNKTFSIPHGGWLLLNDLSKVRRWLDGTKRFEPKFRYRVCHTRDDLMAMSEQFDSVCFTASDIETAASFITCISFVGLQHDGSIVSWLLPFANPAKPDGCHWEKIEDEILAWKILRKILGNKSHKVFQNGGYDCSYLLRYHSPPHNYCIDTLFLFHAIWTESPKKLNFISSVVLDHCRYWKDESKGETKDKKKNERMPQTPKGIAMYWRYCSLDSYNTLLDAIFLVMMISNDNLDWARFNYNVEFSGNVGPALAMSMRGIKLNKTRQAFKYLGWMNEHEKNLKQLRVMCADPEYNPSSPYETASLLYDVLGAPIIKMRGKQKAGGRSVDEKVLKLIRVKHPLYAIYIDKIWATKKPLNNASKYGNMPAPTGRFMYSYGAAATDTGRYNGKASAFWYGNNPQNVPNIARDMMVADPGCILFDADYAQSDAWFIAFECEDENYMRNISDDRDTHSVHAEHFFKIPYEKIYKAHLNEEDWVENPTTGVRQNTKRVVHGANYRMMGYTLYVTLGYDACVAAAKQLGFEDAHLWSTGPRSRMTEFCSALLGEYYKMYKRLPEWFSESVRDAVKNGNRATCAFGRTRLFFGDLANDEAVQRKLSSYFGQGGTSGNINRTLNRVYFQSDLESQGLMILLQTHDSITGQIPLERFDLLNKFLTIMEQPCTIRGRTFTVPVDAKVGFSWKAGMVPYNKDFTIDKAIKKEQTVEAKYQT